MVIALWCVRVDSFDDCCLSFVGCCFYLLLLNVFSSSFVSCGSLVRSFVRLFACSFVLVCSCLLICLFVGLFLIVVGVVCCCQLLVVVVCCC